jgi:hypothetical protein
VFSDGVQGKTIGKPFFSSPQGDKNPTMALLESTSQRDPGIDFWEMDKP